MTLQLSAKPRTQLGRKTNSLRRQGILPGVVYGVRTKSRPLKVNYRDFEKIYKEAGESSIIKLEIKESGKKHQEKDVLIRSVDLDPVTDKFIHVDFFQADLTKKIKAHIPLKFEGVSPAVEKEGGVLIRNINEVEVEALPGDLPKEIGVDISSLITFDDDIAVKDLRAEEGVNILTESNIAVASVIPPRTQEELEELDKETEEDVEGVEVEEKGKKEEEGEGVAEEKPQEGESKEGGEKIEEKKEEK